MAVEVGNCCVLVEATLHTGYGQEKDHHERHQLHRETKAGRNEARPAGWDLTSFGGMVRDARRKK